jgi:hypothetical protein
MPGMALLLAACSSSQPASPTEPTTFVGGSSVSISATPTAAAHAAPPFGCPVPTPLIMPFLVTVTPTGQTGFAVTNITTRFTDSRGVQAPAVTLPAPVPTVQFGTALEQARNPQSFAFDVCRSAGRGTIVIVVSTHDTSGRNATGCVTVAVE